MSAIKVVQAFTKEEEEHRRFMGASRESLRATLRLYSWQTLYSAAVNVVIAAGTALVVYAGARAVMSGSLSRRPADRLHLLPRAALCSRSTRSRRAGG